MTSAPYKERAVDQLKNTAVHDRSLYVSRLPHTLVAKLVSGVLFQEVSDDFDLLLFLHRTPAQLQLSRLLYGPGKRKQPSGHLRCPPDLWQCRPFGHVLGT